jgi:hypothetical protein
VFFAVRFFCGCTKSIGFDGGGGGGAARSTGASGCVEAGIGHSQVRTAFFSISKILVIAFIFNLS